jgi:YVTN family beta-propeller protein
VISRVVRHALGAIGTLYLAAIATASAAVPENVAYVSTPAGVTVIDLARLEPIKEIDVGGKGPRGLAITRDGTYLLTANQESADVSVIDTATFKVVRRIPVGKNPEFMRIQTDGKMAYVTYEPSVVSGPPKKRGKEEEGGSPAEVAAVDFQKGSATSFLMGGKETEGIEFSPDGKYIVVANEGNDTVAIYDKQSGNAIKTVNVKPYGSRPRGVKISPDGRTYVVTMENSNNFVVFDPDFKFIKSVPTEQGPYGVTFDRAGKRILIAAARAKNLQVFDAQTLALIATVPMGERCWHFSFTPDDTKIIAACGRSNDLHVIDAENYKPVKVIAGIKLPWGVVTYPKAFGSLDTP